MKNLEEKQQRKAFLNYSVASCALTVGLFAFAQSVTAQEASLDDGENESTTVIEEVVVTGSRLKKSSFSSASPLQVISGDLTRETGLFDMADILQATSQSSGLQYNNSFNSFVLENGLGASTIGFRGLGAERTLILINGRRAAPAGVGGAPFAADLNLIPTSLVSRIENVFDGASAVYGSDAIAGVSNIILRDDIDGLEFLVEGSSPEAGGGGEFTASAIWGKSGDNWSFSVAGEYYDRKSFTFADSDFFNACDAYRYEDEDGNLLTQVRGLAPGTTDSDCRTNTTNRAFILDGIFGNVWASPGESNINFPGWSETTIGPNLAPFADPSLITQIDSNGDGVLDEVFLIDPDQNGISDIDIQNPYYNFDRSAYAESSDLIAGIKRYSAYATGDYRFEDDNNTEVFFEGLYARRSSDVFSPGSQFFPRVAYTNPFNITNSSAEGANSLGFFGVDFGAFDVIPVLNVRGDRDYNDVTVDQIRLIGGVRGDLGFMDKILGSEWSYDTYVSYSRSEGTDTQTGINGDRVDLSLATTIEDPNNLGSYICGADSDGDGIPDGTDGCVPLNPFAESLFAEGGGTFASQAENDYFMSVRAFDTTIEQTVVNGIAQGDLFALPNGSAVPFLLGYEFRRDEIVSTPNDIAANGSLFGSTTDLGATGSRDLHEVFAETSLELVKDHPWAKELTIDLSGRLTDESYFKVEPTYSIKAIYKPLDFVTFRATYGTSFRAPNLRERFLAGASGFIDIVDVCVVPADAREVTNLNQPNAPEEYRADQDRRSNIALDNCRATGIDPTALGLEDGTGNGFANLYNVEVSTGGSELIGPEKSTSYTLGFVLEQPFTDAFDLKFSYSYFNIDIRDAINEVSPGFVLEDCFENPGNLNGTSGFCTSITRGGNGSIDLIDAGFINLGQETAKGIDFDINYQQDFEIGDDLLEVQLDINATYTEERFSEFDGSTNDDAGKPTEPRWRGDANLILGYKDLRFNWYARYIQGGENVPSEFDPNAVPCNGLNVSCRPIYYTKDYDVHNASVAYEFKDYTFNVGVKNVFNTAPPEVDEGGVFSSRNVPLGIGYDLLGRTFFASVKAKF